MRPFLLLPAALLLSLSAAAASRIEPANPASFELVNLRMTVDSCAFNPGSVRVRASGTTLQLTQQANFCISAGAPQVVDVRLGSLPAGTYRVEVYMGNATGGTPPVETLSFTVSDPAEIAVVPAPPRPLTDYTGMWWNAAESGWGLSLHQSPTHGLFGAWFVYGAGGQPEWYTLQGGQWIDAVTWRGTLYRTTGPFFAGAGYDPRLVLVQSAGSATLDFAQRSGEEGRARLTYTVNGTTTTKTITRMRF